eukprot:scaffold10947_cov123-Isochrysis_galbana.AAC.6
MNDRHPPLGRALWISSSSSSLRPCRPRLAPEPAALTAGGRYKCAGYGGRVAVRHARQAAAICGCGPGHRAGAPREPQRRCCWE